MSPKEKQELANNLHEIYVKQGGRYAVADFLKIPYGSVGHVLVYLGFNQRALQLEKHNYTLAQSRFHNPFLTESVEKYYLIGFILGDGHIHVTGRSHYLNFSSSRLPHLKKIQKLFGQKIYGPNKGNYTMTMYDNSLVQSLLDIGFVDRKSYVGMFLPHVPEEYYYEFLLGLLDSDGSVKNYGKYAATYEWCGHPSYMQEFYQKLKEHGYYPTWNISTEYAPGKPRKTPIAIVAVSTPDVLRMRDKLYARTEHLWLEEKYIRSYKELRFYNNSRGKSQELNEQVKQLPPHLSKLEREHVAEQLGISVRNLEHRLNQLGISYETKWSLKGKKNN